MKNDNSDDETHLSISRDVNTEPKDDAASSGNQKSSPCPDTFQVSSYMWALLIAANEKSWHSDRGGGGGDEEEEERQQGQTGNEDNPTGPPPPWNTLTRDNSWFCDLIIAQSIRWIRDASSSIQGFEWARLASSTRVLLKCLSCIGLLSNLALLDSSMAGAVILQALRAHPILRTIDGARRALAMFMASVPSPDQVSGWIGGVSDSQTHSHQQRQARALEAFLTGKCAASLTLILSSHGQMSFVSQPE